MTTNWHLKEKDYFKDLPDEKKAFIALSKHRTFKKNEFIFFGGDRGNSAFYLVEGKIRVFRTNPLGKDSIIFLRYPGEIFGLSEVIGKKDRVCSAQAITNCSLYEIYEAELNTLLSRRSAFARRAIEVMGGRLEYLGEQIENLMVSDVATRLLKVLLYLGHQECLTDTLTNEPLTISTELTQQQIAEMIGSTQQTISETLKQLEEKKLIKKKNKLIILTKPADLIMYIAKRI